VVNAAICGVVSEAMEAAEIAENWAVLRASRVAVETPTNAAGLSAAIAAGEREVIGGASAAIVSAAMPPAVRLPICIGA
jgi:hypothetical protein